jgi:hypothetical protein
MNESCKKYGNRKDTVKINKDRSASFRFHLIKNNEK